MSIVLIENLSKSYGKNLALNNISFSIEEGEIFGLLGPNGSGKSTIINILSGLLSFEKGNCNILSYNLKSKKEVKKLQKSIGVVPQDYCLYENLKVKENIEFYGRLYGISSGEIEKNTKEVLYRVGLWDKRNSFPGSLSGGMKRRLNIACSIVHKPKLIIMDEPTASLDPLSRDYILNTVKDLNALGSTILYTSHYLEEIELLCTKALILNQGNILALGTANELKSLLPTKSKLKITFKILPSNLLMDVYQLPLVKRSLVHTASEPKNILTFNCENPAYALERLLPYFKNKGLVIEDIEVTKTSLEEVFLHLIS